MLLVYFHRVKDTGCTAGGLACTGNIIGLRSHKSNEIFFFLQ